MTFEVTYVYVCIYKHTHTHTHRVFEKEHYNFESLYRNLFRRRVSCFEVS
jgi:hypothetical protein